MIALPLVYAPPVVSGTKVLGADWSEIGHFYPGDPIRQIERASIRAWMVKHRDLLTGRVLDFGSGDEPYKDLVAGEYVPHEKDSQGPHGYFDAVICNQVLQYVNDPENVLRWAIAASLKRGGHLLLTYATNWDEVEKEDLWRFTKSGMERLLQKCGFTILAHDLRAKVQFGNFSFPLGYGVLCQRP